MFFMARESRKLKADSAYRIRRAKSKKPLRFVELGIVLLFLMVAAYIASFTVHMTKGYTQEKEVPQYFINVQILNGCGEKGIAYTVADKLEDLVRKPLSIRVIDSDNFDRFDVEKTFVISRRQDLTPAMLLAQQLGLDIPVTYREIDDNYLDIGATLVLGKDCRAVLAAARDRQAGPAASGAGG